MSDRKPYERPNSEMTLGEELAAHVAEFEKSGNVHKIAAEARKLARQGKRKFEDSKGLITESIAEILREQGLKVSYNELDHFWLVEW